MSKRAAARFVDEVNQAIERIAAAPKRWPLGPRGTRKVKLPTLSVEESSKNHFCGVYYFFPPL